MTEPLNEYELLQAVELLTGRERPDELVSLCQALADQIRWLRDRWQQETIGRGQALDEGEELKARLKALQHENDYLARPVDQIHRPPER